MNTRKKILIADDDHDLVTLLRERLESSGYDVICAYEGVRALELAHHESPDVIILDWKMPVGRGPDVLKGLKEKNDTRHIPVIILTGVDEPGMERLALSMGAKVFLRKPYESKVLLQKIKEVLQWKELEESMG